ncbi:MAG: PKD domain-containing protein, partial [Candidatus Hydrogenedentes bacterium]|nr:PKD domain-containing protein [Candidatus Hydrogenedentota bacterium]
LEVRKKGSGGFDNWAQMQELIKKSPDVEGRGLHPAVFDGHNRFGPSDNYLSLYTGWLYCPIAGEYAFATTSDDASFLLIDGRLVVQWPGTHGPVADARHNAPLDLTQGAHRLEYYHAEGGGGQVAEAAWRLPGQQEFQVIPPGAFVPFRQAAVSAYEQRDDTAPLDFSFWQESALLTANSLLSAVRFRVDFPSSARHRTALWDFGDGISAESRSPTHVYLAPGVYTVRLTAGDKHVSQRVRVWENEGIGDFAPEDVASHYASLIGSYDLDKVGVDELLTIEAFAQEAGEVRLQGKAIKALYFRTDSYASPAAGRRLHAYAESFIAQGNVSEGFTVLEQLAAKHARREVVCAALHLAGGLLMDAGRADDALPLFEREAASAQGSAKLEAVAFSDLGDYYRRKGEAARARDYYADAREAAGQPATATIRGGYAQGALEYLRRNQPEAALDTIAAWEQAFPEDKLAGYLSVLKAIALLKHEQTPLAFAEVRDMFSCNPGNNYAAHALLLLGDCSALLGSADAAAYYQQLLRDYPESPLCEVAGQRLARPPQSVKDTSFPILDF